MPAGWHMGAVRAYGGCVDDGPSNAIGHGHVAANKLPWWYHPCDVHQLNLLLYVSLN